MLLQLLNAKSDFSKAHLLLLLVIFPICVLSIRPPHPIIEARHSVPVTPKTEYQISPISADMESHKLLFDYISDLIKKLPATTEQRTRSPLSRQGVEFGINRTLWLTLLNEHNTIPNQKFYLRWNRYLVEVLNGEIWNELVPHTFNQYDFKQRQIFTVIKESFDTFVTGKVSNFNHSSELPLTIDIGCNIRIGKGNESPSKNMQFQYNCKLEPYKIKKINDWCIDEWYGSTYFEIRDTNWIEFVRSFNAFQESVRSKKPDYKATHVVWNKSLGEKITDEECREKLHSVIFDLNDNSAEKEAQIAHTIALAFADYIPDKTYTWEIGCEADLYKIESKKDPKKFRLLMCCDARSLGISPYEGKGLHISTSDHPPSIGSYRDFDPKIYSPLLDFFNTKNVPKSPNVQNSPALVHILTSDHPPSIDSYRDFDPKMYSPILHLFHTKNVPKSPNVQNSPAPLHISTSDHAPSIGSYRGFDPKMYSPILHLFNSKNVPKPPHVKNLQKHDNHSLVHNIHHKPGSRPKSPLNQHFPQKGNLKAFAGLHHVAQPSQNGQHPKNKKPSKSKHPKRRAKKKKKTGKNRHKRIV